MAKSSIDRASSEFYKSLVCYGKKLRQRANGRICGACRFYIRGLCVEKDIEVHYEDAVACKFHEEKKG